MVYTFWGVNLLVYTNLCYFKKDLFMEFKDNGFAFSAKHMLILVACHGLGCKRNSYQNEIENPLVKHVHNPTCQQHIGEHCSHGE